VATSNDDGTGSEGSLVRLHRRGKTIGDAEADIIARMVGDEVAETRKGVDGLANGETERSGLLVGVTNILAVPVATTYFVT
jgi:hypothetical protein